MISPISTSCGLLDREGDAPRERARIEVVCGCLSMPLLAPGDSDDGFGFRVNHATSSRALPDGRLVMCYSRVRSAMSSSNSDSMASVSVGRVSAMADR